MIETTIIAFQGKNTRTCEECAGRSGLSDPVIAVNHRATRRPSCGETRHERLRRVSRTQTGPGRRTTTARAEDSRADV